MARFRVVNWNGKDVPSELRDLPAGRYVLAEYAPPQLSADEETGLEEGLQQLDRGESVSWEELRAELDGDLNPRR